MPDWLTIIISIAGALGGRELLTLWLTQRARRRVTDAEAEKTHAEAGLTTATATEKTLEGVFKLVAKLEKRTCELEERITIQEKEIEEQDRRILWLQKATAEYAARVTYLMRGISILIKQIADTGGSPCWQPDEWQPPNGRSEEE